MPPRPLTSVSLIPAGCSPGPRCFCGAYSWPSTSPGLDCVLLPRVGASDRVVQRPCSRGECGFPAHLMLSPELPKCGVRGRALTPRLSLQDPKQLGWGAALSVTMRIGPRGCFCSAGAGHPCSRARGWTFGVQGWGTDTEGPSVRVGRLGSRAGRWTSLVRGWGTDGHGPGVDRAGFSPGLSVSVAWTPSSPHVLKAASGLCPDLLGTRVR